MNNDELVTAVSRDAGYTEKDTALIIQQHINIVKEQVKCNHKVEISGLGTFFLKKTMKRQGINPRYPDQIVMIPGMQRMMFLPDESFKKAVDPNYEDRLRIYEMLGEDYEPSKNSSKGTKVNKEKLVKITSEKTGIELQAVDRILSAYIRNIQETLRKGDSVLICDFGVFKVRVNKARNFRHPEDPKTKVTIPSFLAPYFTSEDVFD